jgi:hypothetical protein
MPKKVSKSKTKKPVKRRISQPTQQQRQNITINVSKPSTRAGTSTKEPTKQPLPMMPSFNINQPSQSTDLSRLLGLLDRRLETETRLFRPVTTPVPEITPVTASQLPATVSANPLLEVQPEVTLGTAIDETIKKGGVPITSQLNIPKPRMTRSKSMPSISQLEGQQSLQKFFTAEPPVPLFESLEQLKEPPEPARAASAQMYVSTQPEEPSPYDKLNERYRKAFGSDYAGDPNIKIRAYTSMIVQQEKLNKERLKMEKQNKKAEK